MFTAIWLQTASAKYKKYHDSYIYREYVFIRMSYSNELLIYSLPPTSTWICGKQCNVILDLSCKYHDLCNDNAYHTQWSKYWYVYAYDISDTGWWLRFHTTSPNKRIPSPKSSIDSIGWFRNITHLKYFVCTFQCHSMKCLLGENTAKLAIGLSMF